MFQIIEARFPRPAKTRHQWLVSHFLFAIVLMSTVRVASATLLLDVSGSHNTFQAINQHEAAAVSFTLTSAITSFNITAPIVCVGCAGGIWLQRTQIGGLASFGDSLYAAAFNNATATATPFFSLPSLAAGTYFLIVSVDSGRADWLGSTPFVTTGTGATREVDFFAADVTHPFVPLNDFDVVFGKGLEFTVNGTLTTTEVPEPGSLPLFGLAICIGLLSRFNARRRSGATQRT